MKEEESMDITATIDTTESRGWFRLRDGWHVMGIDSRDGELTLTSPIVAIDRDRRLVRTESGSVYHVPGDWPEDLDLPAMRAPVPEWVDPEDDRIRALAAYLTEHGAGMWDVDAICENLIPGVTLDAWPTLLIARIRRSDMSFNTSDMSFNTSHPTARDPKAIAEALRDVPALRAWLLAEVDRLRAVLVGGAA